MMVSCWKQLGSFFLSSCIPVQKGVPGTNAWFPGSAQRKPRERGQRGSSCGCQGPSAAVPVILSAKRSRSSQSTKVGQLLLHLSLTMGRESEDLQTSDLLYSTHALQGKEVLGLLRGLGEEALSKDDARQISPSARKLPVCKILNRQDAEVPKLECFVFVKRSCSPPSAGHLKSCGIWTGGVRTRSTCRCNNYSRVCKHTARMGWQTTSSTSP